MEIVRAAIDAFNREGDWESVFKNYARHELRVRHVEVHRPPTPRVRERGDAAPLLEADDIRVEVERLVLIAHQQRQPTAAIPEAVKPPATRLDIRQALSPRRGRSAAAEPFGGQLSADGDWTPTPGNSRKRSTSAVS